MSINRARSGLYWLARFLGDVSALLRLLQGKPGPALRRLGNKAIGRTVVRRMWFR